MERFGLPALLHGIHSETAEARNGIGTMRISCPFQCSWKWDTRTKDQEQPGGTTVSAQFSTSASSMESEDAGFYHNLVMDTAALVAGNSGDSPVSTGP